MADLPSESSRLLAVAPDRFVAERKALAKQLRDEGRADEAKAVEGLKKPTAVVLAVNRGARDRPKAAQAATTAAERVRDAQVAGDTDAFREALRDLESALDLLADVAVAHLSPPGKDATEAMRRRARDLLRSAVADDEARDALARGVLTEELDAPGFSPFAGMAFAAPAGASTGTGEAASRKGPSAAERRQAEKRERIGALREELRGAERELEAATKAAREAERERTRAEKQVESLRKKLGRLE